MLPEFVCFSGLHTLNHFLGPKKPNQLIVQMHVRSFQISSDLAEGGMLGIVISLMIISLQNAVYS